MTLMGWGHDGSLLPLMMGTDYDSDLHWSLHDTRCKTSAGANMSRQRESCRLSFTARLLSLHMSDTESQSESEILPCEIQHQSCNVVLVLIHIAFPQRLL